MNALRFEASEELELREADRDAAIRGWDQDAVEVTLDGDADQCTVEQEENALLIACRVPLAISVPRRTTVRIGQVAGDVLLRDLDGAVSVDSVHGDISLGSGAAAISIQEVHGDLAAEQLGGFLSVVQAHGDVHLSQVGTASLGRVHGDLYARTVDGKLEMGAVNGDVRARDVRGPLTLEEAQGDFRGQDLQGGMNVSAVQGDLALKTALTPGLAYRARAQGDIAARFPAGTSARFTLEAQGTISTELPQVEEASEGRVVGQAGEGEAEVMLHAGGDLLARVRDEPESRAEGWTLDSIAAQIEAEIGKHLGEMDVGALAAREIEKAMRQVEREIAKAQHEAERITQRADERARRAQEKALRKARQFQAKVAHRWGPPSGIGPSALGRGRGSRGPQVSEEERLAVLRMLQEGKISVEEAETLLKALEG